MTEEELNAARSLMSKHLPRVLFHMEHARVAIKAARKASEVINGRWLITDLPEVVAYAKAANAARNAITNHIGRIGAAIGMEKANVMDYPKYSLRLFAGAGRCAVDSAAETARGGAFFSKASRRCL